MKSGSEHCNPGASVKRLFLHIVNYNAQTRLRLNSSHPVFLSDVCYICHIENERMHAMHIASAYGQDCTLANSQATLVNLK
jgi:hypothetical protein